MKNYIGKTFGNLIIQKEVESHIEPSGKKRRRFLVKCACGTEYETLLIYLSSGRIFECKNCSNTKRKKYNIGQKYDMLTIIDYCPTKKYTAICQCDCGNIITKRIDLLKKNAHNNCGCKKYWRKKGMEEISPTFYYRIKRNAKVRNIKFNISIEELWSLFIKQNRMCNISGVELYFSKTTTDNKGTASLDRIDSKKNYTLDNVQWIHKDINLMKMDFDMDVFLDWIQKIHQHQNK